jgi:hypothetical protein
MPHVASLLHLVNDSLGVQAGSGAGPFLVGSVRSDGPAHTPSPMRQGLAALALRETLDAETGRAAVWSIATVTTADGASGWDTRGPLEAPHGNKVSYISSPKERRIVRRRGAYGEL